MDIPTLRGPAILGVDPGKITGVALIDYYGTIIYVGNLDADTYQDFLATPGLDKVVTNIVAEQFILYAHKAQQQTGSKIPSAKIIGMTEMWAKMHRIPIHMQLANILSVAEKQSKLRPQGSHKNMHWVDGYNHAYYWLGQKQLLKKREDND